MRQDRKEDNSVQRELKGRMEDEKNTYQEGTGNNVQPKQSEEGVECDENNQAGIQAKPSEEQVGCLQGKVASLYSFRADYEVALCS